MLTCITFGRKYTLDLIKVVIQMRCMWKTISPGNKDMQSGRWGHFESLELQLYLVHPGQLQNNRGLLAVNDSDE